MRKKIFIMALLLTAGICVACGKEETKGNNAIAFDDELQIDFTYDYSEDIKEDVANVISSSAPCKKNWKI